MATTSFSWLEICTRILVAQAFPLSLHVCVSVCARVSLAIFFMVLSHNFIVILFVRACICVCLTESVYLDELEYPMCW